MTNLRLVLLATTALTAMPFATVASHAQTAPLVLAQNADEGKKEPPKGGQPPGRPAPPAAAPRPAPPAAAPPPPRPAPPPPPAAAPRPAPPPRRHPPRPAPPPHRLPLRRLDLRRLRRQPRPSARRLPLSSSNRSAASASRNVRVGPVRPGRRRRASRRRLPHRLRLPAGRAEDHRLRQASRRRTTLRRARRHRQVPPADRDARHHGQGARIVPGQTPPSAGTPPTTAPQTQISPPPGRPPGPPPAGVGAPPPAPNAAPNSHQCCAGNAAHRMRRRLAEARPRCHRAVANFTRRPPPTVDRPDSSCAAAGPGLDAHRPWCGRTRTAPHG